MARKKTGKKDLGLPPDSNNFRKKLRKGSLMIVPKGREAIPKVPSSRRVVQGFPLSDVVVNMLSADTIVLESRGLEPTVGRRYGTSCRHRGTCPTA